MIGKEILWSTWIDEGICDNIYEDDCNNACDYDEYNEYGCPYKNGCEYDYDFINMIIKENFKNMFNNTGYQYFIIGDSCNWYGGYYGNKPDMDRRVSGLFDSVEGILNMLDYCDDFRIYKGKYNTLWIEGSHHDGSELYQLCRLNKQGMEYLDNDYNFDYRKYAVKSVLKDFDFFK